MKLTNWGNPLYYFAYGSNMAVARLNERAPSSRMIESASLSGHRLRFHKVGMDGSAKCDAFHTGKSSDNVLGAVYKINPAHKDKLDRAEGLGRGYEEKDVTVITSDGSELDAFTYYATKINDKLKPFHWYKLHVMLGAMEHNFPEDYIRKYLAVDSIDDPDSERSGREFGIHGSRR